MPVFLALLLGLVAFNCAASTADSERLSALLDDLYAYQSGFTQTISDSQGQVQQIVKGRLRALRPGLFHWQTEQPWPQTLVSDGDQVWIHDPDLEQVVIQPADQRAQMTPALLLSGSAGRITEAYAVSLTAERDNARSFRLVPKGQDSLFEALELDFKGRTLVGMRLFDGLGQLTELEFHNAVINPPLQAGDFVFIMPEGVDVIRQAPAGGV